MPSREPITDRELQDLLDALSRGGQRAPEHLANRIIAAAVTEPRSPAADRVVAWFAASAWRGAAVAAASVLIGFAVGVAQNPDHTMNGDGYILADTFEELNVNDF